VCPPDLVYKIEYQKEFFKIKERLELVTEIHMKKQKAPVKIMV
jgi:hypothetical protein